MFICRSKGFIFLRVPKTASSSISAHICDHIKFDHCKDAYSSFMGRNSLNIKNHFDANHEHANLENFLKSGLLTDDDVKTLKIYGVLREPVDRIISMFSHVLSNFENIDVSQFSADQILDKGLKLFYSSPKKFFYSQFPNDPNNKRFYPMLPQSNWLLHNGSPISNIILYPKFDDFLLNITSNSNLKYEYKTGILCKSKTKINSDLIKEIQNIYNQDFLLWEKYGVYKS